MKIEYQDHVWDYEGTQTFTNKERIAIEKVLGVYWGKFEEMLAGGSVQAETAIFWTLLRRDDPTFRFDDVEYTWASDIKVFKELEEAPDVPLELEDTNA